MNVDFNERVSRLAPFERAIMRLLLTRLEAGRAEYGPWVVDDDRDYHTEALEEVVDALHYVAALMLRARSGGRA
ncbi:MAG: hypothetical protein GF393_04520 [Armatimonadia bacterium]|nr:hypothetical protein [Armatimonadia bacterium]